MYAHERTFYARTEILELNDNKFEEGVLPGTLATLTRLEMLNLANTQRAGDLAAFDFSGMSAIQQIKLAGAHAPSPPSRPSLSLFFPRVVARPPHAPRFPYAQYFTPFVALMCRKRQVPAGEDPRFALHLDDVEIVVVERYQ